MQWFHQLRVTAKLVGSFLIVAAIGAIIGGLGIFHMGRISAATESLYNQEVLALKGVQEANIHLIYASRAQMALQSASSIGERNTGKKDIAAALQGIEDRMAEVKPLLEDEAMGQALYQQYAARMPQLKQRMNDFVALLMKQSLDSSGLSVGTA